MVGLFKSLRYRVRRYPTFVINGQEKYTGWDRETPGVLLQKQQKDIPTYREKR